METLFGVPIITLPIEPNTFALVALSPEQIKDLLEAEKRDLPLLAPSFTVSMDDLRRWRR